jgi:hypothetical protein
MRSWKSRSMPLAINGQRSMQKTKILVALLLSVGLHVALPLAETIAVRYKWNVDSFDRVVSWPAWFWGTLMPPGHGIPQLVLPFVFSIAFYAAVFWLIMILYERLRKKPTVLADGPR